MKKRIFVYATFVLFAMSLFSCAAQQTVDASEAVSCISSLTQDSKVVVTGELTDELISDIARAVFFCDYKVALDLSDATGLTEWTATRLISIRDEEESPVFQECENLVEIVLPKTITEIGNYAFYDCTSLESVTIPDSVTEIGWQAFDYCTSLKSVVFKDSKNWFDRNENAVDLSNSKKAAVYLTEEANFIKKDETKTSSSSSNKGTSKGGKATIKSSDGKTKVNLIGTWTNNGNNGIKDTLKINSDGTFFYSAYTNSYSGPKQLSHKPDGTMSTSIGYESKGNWRIIDGNILHREYTSSWATDSDILSEVAPRKGEVTDREIRVLGEDQIFFGDRIWTKQ